MPHVSKKLPRDEQLLEVLRRFYNSILELENSEEGRAVLNQIFTKTEKIMLAKRLAIIFMLDNGASFSTIQEILNVSPDTCSRISSNLKKGKYRDITSFHEESRSSDYFKNLVGILDAFTPKRMTSERWSWIDEID